MSAHAPVATREEVIRTIQNKPIPKSVRTAGLGLTAIGAIVFLVGAFMGNQRAWTAFHINWLFFTIIASAGVMASAIMRITTARWCRGVLCQVEGFVAFLPIAFLFLLVIIFGAGKNIYPWWDLVGTDVLIPAKNTYLNHG